MCVDSIIGYYTYTTELQLLIMRKKMNIQEQMARSEEFLGKLTSIKKASKDLKMRNMLAVHRNFWVKEYKYLDRLERDMASDYRPMLEALDLFIDGISTSAELPGEPVLGKLAACIQDQFSQDMARIWSQIDSLPELVYKLREEHESKDKKPTAKLSIKQPIKQPTTGLESASVLMEVQTIFQDISQAQAQRDEELKAGLLLVPQMIHEQDSPEEEWGPGFIDQIKGFGEVKGFDFNRPKLRSIEEGERGLFQYLESVKGQLNEDEICEVIDEYYLATGLLREANSLELENIRLDYEGQLGIDGSFDAEVQGYSQVYQRIQHLHAVYIGRGKSVSLYYERLGIEFPGILKAILEAATRCIEGKIYRDRRIRAALRNFFREREELFLKVEREVAQRIEEKVAKAQRQAELLAKKDEQLKLHQQLLTLRAQHKLRVEEKEALKAQQQLQEAKEQARKQALRKLYLDDLSKRAEEVHTIKQQQQEQVREAEKAKIQQEKLNLKKQMELNRPKVQHRHSLDRRKLQERKV